jgi:hypothetical protein
LVVRVPAGAPDGGWQVRAAFAYCTSGDRAACIPAELRWLVPVHRVAGAEPVIRLTGSVARETLRH